MNSVSLLVGLMMKQWLLYASLLCFLVLIVSLDLFTISEIFCGASSFRYSILRINWFWILSPSTVNTFLDLIQKWKLKQNCATFCCCFKWNIRWIGCNSPLFHPRSNIGKYKKLIKKLAPQWTMIIHRMWYRDCSTKQKPAFQIFVNNFCYRCFCCFERSRYFR